MPGSHHPQFIDLLHRDHATVETDGVRTAKAMGLRDLPSKAWQVNKGWVLAANIAADLTSWARLLGLHDQPDLRDAEPDTLRYRIWHIPERPTPPGTHTPTLEISKPSVADHPAALGSRTVDVVVHES